MKIHRRLIALVGIGMLLIITITVFSLQNITAVFLFTTRGVGHISLEIQRIWRIEKEMSNMSMYVHDFIASGSSRYRSSYSASHAAVSKMLNEMSGMDLGQRDRMLLASIIKDFTDLEKKADRILSLHDPSGADRTMAYDLMIEMDSLIEWTGRDIDKYKGASSAQMGDLEGELRKLNVRVAILFVVILTTTVIFLTLFGLYLYRKISIPLGDLWEGTEAISRGNLDYTMRPLAGEGDIFKLAERFNEMAQKLKKSYADLEQKLLGRTQELAALSSVALALGQAGNLKDVLNNSLEKILASVAGMEPKGGIFLCEPDGRHLRLAVQSGLGKEFEQREATIQMGECLCGLVARTGEMLYSDHSCEDPRHTRRLFSEEHSHIIIPIKSYGKIFGVLFLYPGKQFTLNPSDVQLFDTIGTQLGIAVRNFRLYGDVKESSEKYWDLFENSRDVLFTMDKNGTLTAVNESTVKFTGYSKPELVGKNVMEFLTQESARMAKRVIAGERLRLGQFLELEAIKKDGRHVFVEFSARRLYMKGEPAGFQVSGRDVTEHKRLHEMLVKTERLAAIAQVGIAVRHEINNPLTTVIGNTELMLDRYGDLNEDFKNRLQNVLNNALRIAEIVKRLEDIKQEKIVEYLEGVKMTDLKHG